MKAAVVTGGASGIGRATTVRLKEAGYRVWSMDIAPPDSPVDEVEYLNVDVTKEDEVDGALKAIGEDAEIWSVVTSAGVRGGPETEMAIERSLARLDLPEAEGRRTSLNAFELIDADAMAKMFLVHVIGTYNILRPCLGRMVERGSGSIVMVSSVCGIAGCDVTPHYSSAKAAVIGLMRSLSSDAARSGIRINVVAPGYVKTPLMRQMTKPREADLLRAVPLGRFASASEIADVIAFLASDRASYISGQVISPNGGMAILT